MLLCSMTVFFLFFQSERKLVADDCAQYLKTDLIVGLFGIALYSVGRGHSRSVDCTVVCNDEAVTSVVQFQPIKNGTTCDDGTRQVGEPV